MIRGRVLNSPSALNLFTSWTAFKGLINMVVANMMPRIGTRCFRVSSFQSIDR